MDAQAAHTPDTHGVPAWLIRLCKALSTIRGLFWSSLLNIVLSLIATWLFTANDSNYRKFPLDTLFRHWPIMLISIAILLLLTVAIWALGKLPVSPAPAALKRQYLARRIAQTQDLAIEGIPLLPPRVRLDEIFIPLQLRPHRSEIDQLLTLEQSKREREEITAGRAAQEEEEVLVDWERQHERLLLKSDRIAIQDLWQRLTSEHPAAVIQGRPGMGKSTLLLRLTLYMARRGREATDPLKEQLSPLLVPIFIRLGKYATFREQSKDARTPTIWHYLSSAPDELDDLASASMFAWLCDCLKRGQCLVLLDGLDEVSDAEKRYAVQEAIKAFITDVMGKASGATSYNRFLITSRVAGYKANAFSGYPHYTIADLTQEQIRAFLPLWCRASVYGDIQGRAQEDMTRQATELEQKLQAAIQSHQGIREMVENPFLLTLLAIMQQNGIELPRRRIELYTTVTKILLETRSARRNLTVIPEALAVQRLGPVAYQMLATKNNFATPSDVLTSFARTIMQTDSVPLEQAQHEAKVFLDRIRERSGIFVLRTGDFYGFFHRTFQEYFAARHIIQHSTEPGATQDLLDKARQLDDQWREPFLLAIAYTSDQPAIAWRCIKALLEPLAVGDEKQRYHDVLLAGQCLLEAKPSALPHDIVHNVILALLQIYESALHEKDFEVCEQIEDVMQRLLLDISPEAEHSVLLLTLQDALLAPAQPHYLRAVLTLLTLIAQELRGCPAIVFKRLVPPLLGLTGLPAVGEFQPMPPAQAPDLAIIDLALAALSFLGANGPAGATLTEVRPLFEQHLRQLAHYSLQSELLITPAVVPFGAENYSRYEEGVARWLQLIKKVQKRKTILEQDIVSCQKIQQDLLDAAEEVCYPAETHLLQMVQRAHANTNSDWRSTCLAYLRERMETGTYIDYQLCAQLWSVLFTGQSAQQDLATLLLQHLHKNTIHQRCARRFMMIVVSALRDLRYLRYLRYLRDLSYLSDLSDLSDLLLTDQTITELELYLSNCIEIEQPELLSLLLGRVLQIQEAKEMGPKMEQELQRIVQAALPFALSSGDARDVVLDILRSLPARTEQEIAFILNLARDTQDDGIKSACAQALEYSRPASEGAWKELEQARTFSVVVVREAVEGRLRRRNEESNAGHVV